MNKLINKDDLLLAKYQFLMGEITDQQYDVIFETYMRNDIEQIEQDHSVFRKHSPILGRIYESLAGKEE